MFFLRCAFWLSVVYGSMSWTSGPFVPSRSLTGATPVQTAAVEKVVAGVSDFCAHHIADCAADADRLAALLAHDPGPTATVTALAETDDVPLPVPDPRRHGGAAKLATSALPDRMD